MTHLYDSTAYNKQFHPELVYFVYIHPEAKGENDFFVYYGNPDEEISEWQIIETFMTKKAANTLVVKLINNRDDIEVGKNYIYMSYDGTKEELVRVVRIERGLLMARVYQDYDVNTPSTRHIVCMPIELKPYTTYDLNEEERYFAQFC